MASLNIWGDVPLTEESGRYPTPPEQSLAAGLVKGMWAPVDYVGRVARGQSAVFDPETGHVGDEAIKWANDQAINRLPMRVPASGGEAVFGAGPVQARVGRNGGPPLEAKYARYAEQYPETLPGAPAIDKNTGKAYLEKVLSPEALAFQKDRAKVMKDMKGGYDPFFNPDERFYADASHYPPNQNTLDIVPKKQATIDKDMASIGSDEARARLSAAYERGAQMPNTADWYAMGQLEKAFIDELGPDAGRKAFQDRFATSMAATTGGADPTSNLLMAQYGNYLRENNLPYPTAAHEMPFPIGGRYATGNMEQHQKIFDAGGWNALGHDGANPKRHNFAQNFTGNRNVATMDEQITSGMTPGINMPPTGKYGLYEKVLGDAAREAGVPPANFQDVAWAGFKNQKEPKYTAGQPMISVVNEAIERTHRLTGMPKDEIVRRALVRGEIPLYSQAGSFFGIPAGTAQEEGR
jgi:hypothetical protein